MKLFVGNKKYENKNNVSATIENQTLQFKAKIDMNTKDKQSTSVQQGAFCWAVTGTFHGSIIEAETEGEARYIFHKYYNGESIIHIKKRNVPAWVF